MLLLKLATAKEFSNLGDIFGFDSLHIYHFRARAWLWFKQKHGNMLNRNPYLPDLLYVN